MNPVFKFRATILVGQRKEALRNSVALDEFVEDLPGSSLSAKITHDLDNRHEITDKLRNAFDLLIV